MLASQWGLADQLAGDPGRLALPPVQRLHVRCPRDAKPGDVMQSIRSLAIEELAAPRFMGRLVGNAGKTWPLLIGLPILLLVRAHLHGQRLRRPGAGRLPDPSRRRRVSLVDAAYAQEDGARRPRHHGVHHVPGKETRLIYEELVPHKYIYMRVLDGLLLALFAAIASGVRVLEAARAHGADAQGLLPGALVPVLGEIAIHKRFGSCGAAKSRKWAPLLPALGLRRGGLRLGAAGRGAVRHQGSAAAGAVAPLQDHRQHLDGAAGGRRGLAVRQPPGRPGEDGRLQGLRHLLPVGGRAGRR